MNILAERCNYPKIPKYILILGYSSFGLLSVAAATLEANGKEDDPWHSDTAAICFVFYSVVLLSLTKGLYRLWKYNPNYISLTSVIIKMILVFLLLLTVAVELLNEII